MAKLAKCSKRLMPEGLDGTQIGHRYTVLEQMFFEVDVICVSVLYQNAEKLELIFHCG